MAKGSKDFLVILSGKTIYGNKYSIKINIKDGTFNDYSIIGRPNLHVKEAIEMFAIKKPKNYNDVINVVKLKMQIHNEFVSETRT